MMKFISVWSIAAAYLTMLSSKDAVLANNNDADQRGASRNHAMLKETRITSGRHLKDGISDFFTSPTDEEEDFDKDEDFDDDFVFEDKLNDAIDEALDMCDIDLDSMRFFDGKHLQLNLELFQYYAGLFTEECKGANERAFKTALGNFQQCLNFDIVGAFENFDDAIVGAAFKCAMASAPLLVAMDNTTRLMDFDLPYECSGAFLGRNPVGDMIRNTVLHPDRVLKCFSDLAGAIPHCTLDAWPVPIVGPILRRVSCFLGRQTYFLETISQENLDAFDQCLPELNEDIDEDECDKILYKCDFVNETEFLLPVPFSDLTQRVARTAGMFDVVERYDNFFEKCNYERWAGWQYDTANYTVQFGGQQAPRPSGGQQAPSAACGDGQSSLATNAACLGTQGRNRLMLVFLTTAIATAAICFH